MSFQCPPVAAERANRTKMLQPLALYFLPTRTKDPDEGQNYYVEIKL